MAINKTKILSSKNQNDPTYENYLRFAEWIFTGKMNTSDLMDEEEAEKRMAEIDEIRATGSKTEAEQVKSGKVGRPFKYEEIKEDIVLDDKIRTLNCVVVTDTTSGEVMKYKSVAEACRYIGENKHTINSIFRRKGQNTTFEYNGYIFKKDFLEVDSKAKDWRTSKNAKVRIKDLETGKEEIFNHLTGMCKAKKIRRQTLVQHFIRKESDRIIFRGYEVELLRLSKEDSLKEEQLMLRREKEKLEEWEIAYIVQEREKDKTWKDISKLVGRDHTVLSRIYSKIKLKDELDKYRKMKVSKKNIKKIEV